MHQPRSQHRKKYLLFQIHLSKKQRPRHITARATNHGHSLHRSLKSKMFQFTGDQAQTDLFCQHAGFIEGGFPVSPDMDGLTISPSNTLIRFGHVSSDWINGMLAWKILLSED